MLKRFLAALLSITITVSVFSPVAYAYGESQYTKGQMNQKLQNINSVTHISYTEHNPFIYDSQSDEIVVLNQNINTASSDSTKKYTSLDNAAYDLRIAMKNRQSSVSQDIQIKVSSSATSQDVFDMIKGGVYDKAISHTGVPDEGDYIRWNIGKTNMVVSISPLSKNKTCNVTVTFGIDYLTTAEQENRVTAKINTLVKSLGLDSNESDYSKIKKIYNYICKTVQPDNENPNNNNHKLRYSTYAAAVNGLATSQGFTSFLYRLALEAGIDCRVISGYGNITPHCWNIVKLNGLYYFLDSAWDAGKTSKKYFLKADSNFPNHAAFQEYATAEFKRNYPVSHMSYVDGRIYAAVISHPVDVAVFSGEKARITFTATGDGISYTWYYKDKGAAQFTKTESFKSNYYSVIMNDARNGRQVYCVVKDKYGNSATTDTVTISMKTPLSITKQPESVNVESGKTAKVSIAVTGDGLTYAWYYKDAKGTKFNKTDSFKSNSYSISMNSARAGRQVYCVVTDKYGSSVTTDTVTLNMKTPASIVTQPQNSYGKSGQTVVVRFEAEGDGLTYTWYYKNKSSSRFIKTDTFKSNTYSISMNRDRNGRQVYCIIKDKYGNSIKTDTVKLIMGTPVSIVAQTQNASALSGKKATVKVNAVGDGLTYTWYYKDRNSSEFVKTDSFKGSAYSITMNSKRAGRQVYCVVADKYGNSIKTDTVTIDMVTPLSIVAQPKSTAVKHGETATVTVNAAGDGLTYTWYYKDRNSSKFVKTDSFKGPVYSITMNNTRNGRQVYCVITDKYGNSVKTDIAMLSKSL